MLWMEWLYDFFFFPQENDEVDYMVEDLNMYIIV